jgi:asparagine synthase (glutamine-hydrolysing)
MCNIFALLNEPVDFNIDFIQQQFEKGKGRGPEDSKLLSLGYEVKFGFHRLAINGLNSKSNQPIFLDNIILICNGEIYNYKELYNQLDVTPVTDSDCEIIIHLYKSFGIEQTLQLIDGEFAFILYDMDFNHITGTKMFIARDPLGVRPLYILKPSRNNNDTDFLFGFASELKMLSEFFNFHDYSLKYELHHFKPGTFSVFEKTFKILSKWVQLENKPYFALNASNSLLEYNTKSEIDFFIQGIQKHLYNAVKKRYFATERPIACLLSGGLDSSLITALVCDIHKEYSDIPIETYSIGLANSTDLHYAKLVAEHLKTNHTEIIVTEKDMLDVIPEVIQTIESYDTTTVRASIGNYLLGKYISKNSKAKVIFNGDGSDELCGGYIYMNKAPNSLEFDKETRRLLTDIHMFDVLRSDKCISSHGLESRTAFLDKNFVNYYLSIPHQIRIPKTMNKGEPATNCEKYLLRRSFANNLLPEEIIWRKKEAFSDGVSSTGRSLYTIIQEHVNEKELDLSQQYTFNPPQTKEQLYYRNIYHSFYPNLEELVPYFWMPKYIQATDPSARTLAIYDS